MCGIWAVFGCDEDVATQSNAVHKIAHRGPDAFRIESVNHFPNCCLGFHRLSIVEDLRGMQPLRVYSHPHLWIICNGEIYNYQLLAKDFNFAYEANSDIESIIHLYEKGGIEFAAQHLDGVFAFCLLDTANRKVFIARDVYGVRPLFRIQSDDGFLAVCSEAKGLMGLASNKSGRRVEAFLPGHLAVYDLDSNGAATLREEINFNKVGQKIAYNTLAPPLVESIQTNIYNLLEHAVTKRMMSDRRIGCLLSGGFDSSIVASIIVKNAKMQNLPYKIQTFSIGMESSPDLVKARMVSEFLGTEHHEVILSPEQCRGALRKVIYHLECYDITTVRSSIGLYLICKYIREKTDSIVILSGEGSDEVAQGYIYFDKAPSAEKGDEESRRLLKDLYLYDVLRADRMIASWGLEARVPFLDHNFTSYYLSLPPELRQPKNGIEKYLLRSAFDKKGLVPDETIWRPKEAFSDGMSSMKKSLFEVLQEGIESQVSDAEFENARVKYPYNSPTTKEAYYYREIFNEFYPGSDKFTPYFWMPKWINATDPSARVLKHYKQNRRE